MVVGIVSTWGGARQGFVETGRYRCIISKVYRFVLPYVTTLQIMFTKMASEYGILRWCLEMESQDGVL